MKAVAERAVVVMVAARAVVEMGAEVAAARVAAEVVEACWVRVAAWVARVV